MPRSFLIRKKSTGVSRVWEDLPVSRDAIQEKDSSSENSQESYDRKCSETSEETATLDTEKEPVSEDCTVHILPAAKVGSSSCLSLVPDRAQKEKQTSHHIQTDVFSYPRFGICKSYLPSANYFPPELGHISRDHEVLPSVQRRPPLFWNASFSAHASSFIPVQLPVPAWMPPVQPTQCHPRRWGTLNEGKTHSSFGVLSPAEIPSPSSSASADEPTQHNSAAMPALPVTQLELRRPNNESSQLLHGVHLCCPVTEPVPYVKASSVKVEYINNGFGIKNPLLIGDKQGQLHTEVTPIAPPSPYLIPSDGGQLCTLCGWRADSPRQLQKHMKSHKEIKRFLCTVCGKGFNDTFDLKRHTRTHTGVRPYRCEKCGKSFTQRCSLESHSKKIHGINYRFAFNERRTKVYVCEDCGHSTSDPEDHFLHLRTQHPSNPALLRCHDRRQFKFGRRKNQSFEEEDIEVS